MQDNQTTEASAAELAERFINHTRRSVFLTGKAGSGKTTFLRALVKSTYKNTMIVAPTGIAAINAGGVTIHSLFQLPFGAFLPVKDSKELTNEEVRINTISTLRREQRIAARKRRLLRELELLIIDEVSMLRADLLDAIDQVLRFVRANPNVPFGGVQVLFIGDLSQLPPVVKEQEWKMLREHYNSMFFFDAKVFQEARPVTIELDKIYRQSDPVFVSLLNRLRENKMTKADADLLNTYFNPGADLSGCIRITTHNSKADQINKKELNQLHEKSFVFEAEIKGEFPESMYPIETTLELKKGAQVMFVRNDPTGLQQFFNGKLAIIRDLGKEKIVAYFPEENKEIEVKRQEWKNVKYVLNEQSGEIEEKEAGSFFHYPLKLAWAITVHKSQGLTFNKAAIDIEDVFAPGQMYVALSRLTGLQGLILTSKIPGTMIAQDRNIRAFEEKRETKATLVSIARTEAEEFLKNYALQSFSFQRIAEQAEVIHNNTSSKQRGVVADIYGKEFEIIYREIAVLQEWSSKFAGQLNAIVNDKHFFAGRVKAAKDYFFPRLIDIREKLTLMMMKLEEESRVEQFIEDIELLGESVTSAIYAIHRSEKYATAVAEGKEINKSAMELKLPEIHVDKESLLEKITKAKETRKAEKKQKQKKIPTQVVSLNLFKRGLSLEEIAAERGIKEETVAAHLAHFIENSTLDIHELMPADRINMIMDHIRNADVRGLKALKELLPEDISYRELKWVLAAMKQEV
ncbi:MAG: helix-turn-helix domain-containing protein [Bacteroidia bacterium]